MKGLKYEYSYDNSVLMLPYIYILVKSDSNQILKMVLIVENGCIIYKEFTKNSKADSDYHINGHPSIMGLVNIGGQVSG